MRIVQERLLTGLISQVAWFNSRIRYGCIAQLAERPTVNRVVIGSSPFASAILLLRRNFVVNERNVLSEANFKRRNTKTFKSWCHTEF